VRETHSATASTNGLICSDVDGEDDCCFDGCFDFDDSLATFDRGEEPVVWNTPDAKAAAPSKEEDVQKSAAPSASAASASAMWTTKTKYNLPGLKNTLVRTTGNLNMAALGKLHYARLIHMIVPQLPDFEGSRG
jgi:hypothetical protein